jgi:hypothetical protein
MAHARPFPPPTPGRAAGGQIRRWRWCPWADARASRDIPTKK